MAPGASDGPRIIEDIFQRMIDRGWAPGTPATEIHVRRFESDAGLRLPDDYRTFMLYCGGGEPGAVEGWRSLWRLVNLWEWNVRFHIPESFPGLLGIGNEAFMLYALDFRDPDRTPIVSLGLSSSTWDDVIEEAATFQDWLDRMVPR